VLAHRRAKGDQQVEIVLQPADWFEREVRQQHLARVGHNPTLVLRVDDCPLRPRRPSGVNSRGFLVPAPHGQFRPPA